MHIDDTLIPFLSFSFSIYYFKLFWLILAKYNHLPNSLTLLLRHSPSQIERKHLASFFASLFYFFPTRWSSSRSPIRSKTMSGHAIPPPKSARLPSWKIGKVMVLCFYLFLPCYICTMVLYIVRTRLFILSSLLLSMFLYLSPLFSLLFLFTSFLFSFYSPRYMIFYYLLKVRLLFFYDYVIPYVNERNSCWKGQQFTFYTFSFVRVRI